MQRSRLLPSTSATSLSALRLKSCFNSKSHVRVSSRFYHSYPDPNEKPNITYAKANATEKMLDKNDKKFQLDDRFKIDNLFPGTPISKGISKENAPQTIVSTLENGLTVASQEMPGLMSSFSFLVKAGSAFEIQSGDTTNTGSVQFLELSAFRSTQNRPDRELITEVENLGGMVQCMASKDSIVYFIDILRQHAEEALDILSDTICNPIISEGELEEVKSIIQYQNVMSSADALSREAAMMAAYAGSSLGNSHICPLERLELVNRTILQEFRSKYFFAENCIISGVGIDHESLVELARKKFSTLPGRISSNPIATTKRAKATFSGSLVKNERKLQEPFVKVAICFEAGDGWSDPSLVALCVLQTLLGGGKSFSAGGPGKGMYTRLYTQMLNRNQWAESVESFIVVHDESAILGIDGACEPDYVQDLIKEIVEHLTKLAFEPVSTEELMR
eukprot:gene27779-36579_t